MILHVAFISLFCMGWQVHNHREGFPMLNEPRDFIGNILAILLERELDDERRRSEVLRWNMSVVLDTDYYPVTLHFSNGIRIERGLIDSPTLRLVTTLSTIVLLAGGRLSPVRGILQGRLKLSGLIRHPIAALRFYRLMMGGLRG